MNQPISVLIADDHPVFRKGLRDVIEEDSRFQIVFEAENGETVLNHLDHSLPDILILDIDMPNVGGLDVARIVQKRNLDTRVVILTMYKEEYMFNKAMDVGVRGYVLKDNAVTDILHCLKAVAEGRYCISPTISDYLLRRSGHQTSSGSKGVDQLTPAERRILSLIADNLTNKQIADKISISYKTVERHRENIARKLDLHGAHSLLKFALENKSNL